MLKSQVAAHSTIPIDSPVDIRQVKVEGEIGRRIGATIKNNLLKIDVEKNFLQPYRNRNQKSGFIGVGMFIDSLVRFAVYSADEEGRKRGRESLIYTSGSADTPVPFP